MFVNLLEVPVYPGWIFKGKQVVFFASYIYVRYQYISNDYNSLGALYSQTLQFDANPRKVYIFSKHKNCIVDYKSIFIKIKNLGFSEYYGALFFKVEVH